MRNASDIFCLNEESTDGMGMFSIGGACPGKLRRRPQVQQDECFEYGRTNLDSYSGGDSKVEKADMEQLESPRYSEEEPDHEDIPPVPQTKGTPLKKTSHRKMDFKKINKKAPEPVSSSNMERNPLTGAGMEMPEYRRPKKQNPNKSRDWQF